MVTGVGNSGTYYNHYNPDTAVDEASASLPSSEAESSSSGGIHVSVPGLIGGVAGAGAGYVLGLFGGGPVAAAVGFVSPSIALGTGGAFLGREIGEQFTFPTTGLGYGNYGGIGAIAGGVIGAAVGIPLDIAASEVTVPIGFSAGVVAGAYGGLAGGGIGAYKLVSDLFS
jgi:hypothetical protein